MLLFSGLENFRVFVSEGGGGAKESTENQKRGHASWFVTMYFVTWVKCLLFLWSSASAFVSCGDLMRFAATEKAEQGNGFNYL